MFENKIVLTIKYQQSSNGHLLCRMFSKGANSCGKLISNTATELLHYLKAFIVKRDITQLIKHSLLSGLIKFRPWLKQKITSALPSWEAPGVCHILHLHRINHWLANTRSIQNHWQSTFESPELHQLCMITISARNSHAYSWKDALYKWRKKHLQKSKILCCLKVNSQNSAQLHKHNEVARM